MKQSEQQHGSVDGRSSALHVMRRTGLVHTPTVAEVDLSKLLSNLDIFRATGAAVMAVVKAEAYGHGAVRVAGALSDAGVEHFAVATVPEGVQLRRSGLNGRILVFAAPLPEYLGAYARHDLEVTVCSDHTASAVCEAAGDDRKLRVHVKVDTGMGRIGVPMDRAEDVIRRLDAAPGVVLAGLWTHFATADEPDLDFTHRQLDHFRRLVDGFGDAAENVHAANSAAALRLPQSYAFDRSLIRVGIGLYGYTALNGLAADAGLRPVMRMTSRVTQLKWVEPDTTISYGRRWRAERRTRIATVGAGYADGYPRLVTNRASVGIGGGRYPVAGTVCMDMFMVDVDDRDDVQPGDEVVLFGDGGPDAFELGTWAETIPYEILTRVAPRVPRAYVNGGARSSPAR